MRNKRAEESLLNAINSNFDNVVGDNPAALSNGPALSRAKGNPSFRAQFDIDVTSKFYTVLAGVYTEVTPAALDPALQNQLGVFIFGNSDFASGFGELKRRLPLNGWDYNRPLVVGKDDLAGAFANFDANVTGQLLDGDLLILASGTEGGIDYQSVIRLRSQNVLYGTLLNSIGSDTFVMNMNRYILEPTDTLQFTQSIRLIDISLFGKTTDDSVNPNSFKMPEQFQNGIIDVPIKKGIDKHSSLATYLNYDVQQFSWQIFVLQFNKLGALS